MSNTVPPHIAFDEAGPFHRFVSVFIASTAGLGPVFDTTNPLKLDASKILVYRGRIQPQFAIDAGQLLPLMTSGALSPSIAVESLCCMLVTLAYQTVEDLNDRSAEFEAFRHFRNAAAHGNRFHFVKSQPARSAQWRTFRIPAEQKGGSNPLQGKPCFGEVLSPADVILLLWDIEQRLKQSHAPSV